jgi:hypothetical protein
MSIYTQQIPDEPHRRRMLVLLDRHAAHAYRNEAWYGKLGLDPAVAVVLVDPERHMGHAVMDLLQRTGLERRNQLLALNPFNWDEYQEPKDQVLGLPVAKARIMRRLAQLLGATSFSLEVEHKSERTSEWKSGVKASAPKGGGGAMLHRAMVNLADRKATVAGKFSGGDPAIDQAEALLNRAGLSADGELRSLLEAARPGPNRVLQHTCAISAVNEARKTIDMTAEVKVPGIIECTGEFVKNRSDRTEYRMKADVRWEPA